MNNPTKTPDTESFFTEPADPWQEARVQALEIACRLLIWMSDSQTLEDRGLRASVGLYCVRPDLLGNAATLEEIGMEAGCTRQAVHKLANSFRQTMGMQE